MGIFVRGKKLWCRYKDEAGGWSNTTTGYDVGQEADAEAFFQKLTNLISTGAAQRARDRQVKQVERKTLVRDSERRAAVVARLDDPDSPGVGTVYAVQLDPILRAERLKIGFTSKAVRDRFKNYLTFAPEARLIATWHGDVGLERQIHRTLPGRIGQREVFDVQDVMAALELIDSLGKARLWTLPEYQRPPRSSRAMHKARDVSPLNSALSSMRPAVTEDVT